MPVAPFGARMGGAVSVFRQQYTVAAYGRGSLRNTVTEDRSVPPITIIQNWQPREGASPVR